MKQTIVAPSILSCDFGYLRDEIKSLEAAGADMLHLDVMDGHYVPNLSFGVPLIKYIRKYTELPLDVHLMVTNPADFIDILHDLRVDWISFHSDTEPHTHRLVHKIKDYHIKAGLAINPAVGLTTLEAILDDLDYVLLMSVNPGYSGQSFIESTLNKTRDLKAIITARKFDTQIEVDGGVNNLNSSLLVEAGADILVSASYIFSQPDYTIAIRSLKHV